MILSSQKRVKKSGELYEKLSYYQILSSEMEVKRLTRKDFSEKYFDSFVLIFKMDSMSGIPHIAFYHDTHNLRVTDDRFGRYVHGGCGHKFSKGFPSDARCAHCVYSSSGVNESSISCTIKLNVQIQCSKLVAGDNSCGHMRDCIHQFICKNGGVWSQFAGEIIPIERTDGETITVPNDGLCYVYSRKIPSE